MNVKEILHREPPAVLYHYTTQQGLLGIIDNKEIWATHTQYLNDVREFRHARDLLREEASKLAKERLESADDLQGICEMLSEDYEYESVYVCVCSFSEKGDSLSQWRAYGGRASGFAIGFSGEYLRQVSGAVPLDTTTVRAVAEHVATWLLSNNQHWYIYRGNSSSFQLCS